jgi:hypothetical protein
MGIRYDEFFILVTMDRVKNFFYTVIYNEQDFRPWELAYAPLDCYASLYDADFPTIYYGYHGKGYINNITYMCKNSEIDELMTYTRPAYYRYRHIYYDKRVRFYDELIYDGVTSIRYMYHDLNLIKKDSESRIDFGDDYITDHLPYTFTNQKSEKDYIKTSLLPVSYSYRTTSLAFDLCNLDVIDEFSFDGITEQRWLYNDYNFNYN